MSQCSQRKTLSWLSLVNASMTSIHRSDLPFCPFQNSGWVNCCFAMHSELLQNLHDFQLRYSFRRGGLAYQLVNYPIDQQKLLFWACFDLDQERLANFLECFGLFQWGQGVLHKHYWSQVLMRLLRHILFQ